MQLDKVSFRKLANGLTSEGIDNLAVALRQAKNESRRYSVWFVKQVGPETFKPWAHDSGADCVACFINGERFWD